MHLQYAAGFFDGEGCIHIARTLRVIISGCFRPGLLELFADHWGGQVRKAVWCKQKKHRPGVRWEVTGPKAAAFLVEVLDLLVEKKDQAILALQFHTLKQSRNVRGGKGYTTEQRQTFQAISLEIRQMKKISHTYTFSP